MKNKLMYSFDNDLKESLKDPKFKKAWDESEAEYLLAKEVIEKRLAKKLSQRDLAKKLNTSQAVVSRIETMQANPSMAFLKKLASALNTRLVIRFTSR